MSFQVKYIYDLVDKISPSLQKVKNNLQNTANSVKTQSQNIGRSLDNVKIKMQGLAKSFGELGRKLFLRMTLPVGILGASFIKAASDAEETSSKFATVFQDVGSDAEKMANSIAKNFGLSSIKAKELLGDTGDLLTGFGFTGKAALDLAAQTNKLAVDLASFTNFSGGAEGASKALTKALLGERESVKSLGISILEEDVNKKISLLKSQGMTFESERQAKAIATLKIAYEQSKNAIGDFARTSESFANKSRVLSARILDLKIKLGNILLPYAVKLIVAFTNLAEKFTNLSPQTQKLILIIAGLAAILPPILITIGLMASGVGGLITTFGFLAIAATKVAAAVNFFTLAMRTNPIGLMITALITALFYWREIRDIILKVVDTIKNINFSNIGNQIKGFFGVGGSEKNTFVQNNTIPQQTLINQRQTQMGGRLDVNFNKMPKDTNVQFTPVKQNSLDVGLNPVYGGF